MIEEPTGESTPPDGGRRPQWRVLIVLIAVAALVGSAAVALVASQDGDEQRPRDEAAPDDTEDAEDTDGELDDIDPILFECLAPAGGLDGFNQGEGSIPDADIDVQVEAIAKLIEDERGLTAGDDIDIEFVSIEEVAQRAVDSATEELDPAETDVAERILTALGAVEPGTDLLQTQLDALDTGIGGFYQPETGQMVIGSESMDGMGAFIASHELVHAMADAELGLPDVQEIDDRDGGDAAYAALSAIEGDASLYSQQFIVAHLPFEDLLVLEGESGATIEAMEELPHFVTRNLTFPYDEGLAFTCDVFLDGGWDAVNDTYHEIPQTSAQILFPDRYRDGELAEPIREPAGPAGWEHVDTDTFGAADLLFLLEAPGDNQDAALSDPVDRAAAWAGGQVSVWSEGEDSAVGVILAERAADYPLCDTVADVYAAAFPDAEASTQDGRTSFDGSDQAAVVSCDDDEIALGIGPNVEIATAAIS